MKDLSNQNQEFAGIDLFNTLDKDDHVSCSEGSSMQESELSAALDQALDTGGNTSGKQPKQGKVQAQEQLIDLAQDGDEQSSSQQNDPGDSLNEEDNNLNSSQNSLLDSLLQPIQDNDDLEPPSLSEAVQNSGNPEEIRNTLFPDGGIENIDGDFLNPKGGLNVVTGSDKNDFILANEGGFNLISSGEGTVDHIVIGKETTNAILDFNAESDMLVLDDDLKLDDLGAIGIGDSTLIVDKTSNQILAALASTQPQDLSANINFTDADVLNSEALDLSLEALGEEQLFANVDQGEGLIEGTSARDKLVGGDENDVLQAGDIQAGDVQAEDVLQVGDVQAGDVQAEDVQAEDVLQANV